MKLRRLSIVAATSALVLALPASAAFGFAYVPNRSDAGGRGATNAENWVSVREVLTDYSTPTEDELATANALLAHIDFTVDTAFFVRGPLPEAGKPGRGLDRIDGQRFAYLNDVIAHVLLGAPAPTPPTGIEAH